jgi:hypothetical protein
MSSRSGCSAGPQPHQRRQVDNLGAGTTHRQPGPGQEARVGHRPGAPSLAVVIGDQVDSVVALTMRDSRIVRVDIIRAPVKVRAATSALWASAHGGRRRSCSGMLRDQ